MSERPRFALLIISDGQPALVERIARALAGAEPGRVAILLREPGLASGALLALARALGELTKARGAELMVSDRVDIALAAGAAGVQLPEAGFSPQVARALLGPRALVGASRHGAEGLARAAAEGADYATLSPVHPVEGKGPALGLDGFAQLAARAPLPVYALGGVQLADVAALRARGARGVAVMREVLAAPDPAEITRRLLAALA